MVKKKVEKKKKVSRTVECPACNGRGLLDNVTLCADCEGSGKVKKSKKGKE